MNPEDFSRDDLLADSQVATPWLIVGLILALLFWGASLRWRSRIENRSTLFILGAVGAFLLSLGLWLGFQVAGRGLTLATSWSLAVLAALGGVAAEIIIGLYRLERKIVTPPSRGRLLLMLRLGALVVLLLVLLQPERTFLVDNEINREVVVLLDDSDSMQLADQRLTSMQMLDRAELFGVAAARGRLPIRSWSDGLAALRESLAVEQGAYEGVIDPASVFASRQETIQERFTEAGKTASRLVEEGKAMEARPGLSEGVRRSLGEVRQQLSQGVEKAIAAALEDSNANRFEPFLTQVEGATQALDGIGTRLPPLRLLADREYLDALPEREREAIAEAAGRPRIEIAKALLSQPVDLLDGGEDGGSEGEREATLIGRLEENYNLRFYRFAREPGEFADAEAFFDGESSEAAATEASGDAPESSDGSPGSGAETRSGGGTATDLTAALEQILDNSSPESLAGILLLSDGRHNGGALPEDALRQLGVQNSPLSAVAVGGSLGPVDVSILGLSAPESVYLGDRVGVRAEVKFDGLRGQQVRAVLRYGGEIVDEEVVSVPDVDFRTELRFVHLPEEKGIYDYEVELEPLESELFDSNNAWRFKTAVTDDRTNVLLVDGFPRWEFRYLRNLFYGRDKSVHLQYVLLRPDRIEGVRGPTDVAASATRPFGEAEANSLPDDIDEWRLFDVIILGDIPPGAISFEEWNAIREAVTERGALLVCVGGPRYMPHAHESKVLQDLLPVTWDVSTDPIFASPEEAYRIAMTTAGRSHPVMAQSTSRSLNAQLWAQMPPATWRNTVSGIKEGAEVLAYADPLDGGLGASAVSLDGSPESVERAIEQLANRKTFEQEHALVTVQRAGLGKVVMMNFDQTWRFRYGVGDTYHHRFWGQVVRWGAGENLRSGGERVRLGTDRITYTPSDPVDVLAKVLDGDRRPVTDAELVAVLYRDGQPQMRQKMSYRTGSSGVYETSIAALPQSGDYTIRLEGPAVDEALAAEASSDLSHIETELVVVASRNPVELAELTADRDFLAHAAQVSGGRLAEIGGASSLLDTFGAPREVLTERRRITLWDQWPVIAIFLGLLTTEWVLRRRSGLA